jgi:uncharacterized protein involved in outer membrane biogenesis
MRRAILVIIVALTVLLLAAGGAALYLVNDTDFLKSRLADLVREQTGRELTVDGLLELEIGRITRLRAADIRLQNAPWSEQADMARIGRLEVELDITSLWAETLLVPDITVTGCSVSLARNGQGEANWQLLPESQAPPADQASPARLPLIIEKLELADCNLVYDTPDHQRPLELAVESLRLQTAADLRLEARAEGQINGEPFELDGWYGPLGTFYRNEPLQHELSFSLGAVLLESSGTLQIPRSLGGANVKFRFQGPDITSILQALAVPPISEGAFDFRLDLVTEGDLTRLQLDGDLGSLQATASGELDQLLPPRAGRIEAIVSGPDLRALGQAAGIEGLVPDAFELQMRATFDGRMIRIQRGLLETDRDRLQVAGDLHATTGLGGTTLDLDLTSDEIGRWAPLLHRPERPLGPIAAKAGLSADAGGLFSVSTELTYGKSRLALAGAVGALGGPYQPDLSIDFNSTDPGPVAALAGWDHFPAVPLTIKGSAALAERQFRFDGIHIALAGDRATVDGWINLADQLAGSELEVTIDVANMAALMRQFGQSGAVDQPLHLAGTLRPEGKGLAFEIRDGDVSDVQFDAAGAIPDLARPLAVDARFDIRLPSARMLGFLAPGRDLPDLPLAAVGSLHNEPALTRLGEVRLTLGPMLAGLDGTVGHDGRFDLRLEASGQDASALSGLARIPLEAEPFSVATRVHGRAEAFELSGLDLRLGDSDLKGRLEIRPGAVTGLAGELQSEFLDLSQRRTAKGEDPSPEAGEKSAWLFPEQPVTAIADYGITAVLDLRLAELDLGNTQIEDIVLGVSLGTGMLALDPLSMADRVGGTVTGSLTIDGRGTPPRLEADLRARGLRLGLAALPSQDISTFPPTDIDVRLAGSGETWREVASGANGKVRAYQGKGLVASAGVSLLLSDFITELFNLLNPFAQDREYTELECSVAAADIRDGQVEVFPVIFQTRELTILSQGKIDLQTERLDLSFNTKPRKGLGLSAGMIINPLIKVGGRLKSPAIEVDPAGALVSGGLAVATAGISLVAKSVSDRFLSSKDPCGEARQEIENRDRNGG